ncbi:MAG TPA: hypothetical protein VD790_05965 [Thermoleophilaceae bacterium]|nr:hypothetical protein [Thermoleophilaceae bacterium]
MLIRLTTLCLAAVLALALPGAAWAQGDDAIRDCAQDGDLDRGYSDGELEDANDNLPADLDQYSDCRSVLAQAQGGGDGSTEEDGTGSGGPSTGSGGGADGTDAAPGTGGTASDQSEIAEGVGAARAGTEPAVLGDPAYTSAVEADDGLPTAAIIALVLLVLAALGGGLYAARDRLPAGVTSRIPGLKPGAGR